MTAANDLAVRRALETAGLSLSMKMGEGRGPLTTPPPTKKHLIITVPGAAFCDTPTLALDTLFYI